MAHNKDGSATLKFPTDDYALDFSRISLNTDGKLNARVTARHGDEHLHTARFDLLDQWHQEFFHERCQAVNGNVVDWQSRLQVAIPGLEKLPQTQHARPPEALRRALDLAASYPIEALGPFAAPMAKKLRQVIQAPDAICGQSVLAASALAVQGHADVVYDGRIHPLTLFLVAIAESGERKTTTDHAALWPHATRQNDVAILYRTHGDKEATYHTRCVR